MPTFTFDFHIHTSLSPYGENNMTPPNIVNMAILKGLNLIAITDHDSTRNMRALMEVARGLPRTVLLALELTTAE